MNLSGAVCIVTGSATGVGAECARQLSEKGARVVINYTRSEAEARKTQADCENFGAETLLIRADVAIEDDCARMAAAALERWGRIDALVNNAATTKASNPFDLGTLSKEDFLRVLSVNVLGAFQMIRAVEPAMKSATSGAIVNVSSNVAITGGGSSIAYTASKGALNAMTLMLARTLGPRIRVNAVCPGVIDTRWMRESVGQIAFEALSTKFAQTAPMGRVARPGDVASAIVWLIEGTDYVTGELLMVDGGIRLSGGAPRASDEETPAL